MRTLGLAVLALIVTAGGFAQAQTCASSGQAGTLIVPECSSNPAAAAKIYLDFDGDGPRPWGPISVPATPAYSADLDTSAFSDQELLYIKEIWARVSEFFSPFNLDVVVTRNDPGVYPDKIALKAVIGGDGAWVGQSVGGKSVSKSFSEPAGPNVVYVFSKNTGYAPQTIAPRVGYQAGDALGLTINYTNWANGGVGTNLGNGQLAPIMGQNSTGRVLWWQGYNPIYGSDQDELALLSGLTNGFGYRADDHGDDQGHARPLPSSAGAFAGSGVIERPGDADYFSFTLPAAGEVTINGNASRFAPGFYGQYGAMLDPQIKLFADAGPPIAISDCAGLDESMTVSLPKGDYFIEVSGHGMVACLDVASGASFGKGADIGRYSITVTPHTAQPAYTITASAGAGGSITPSGAVSLDTGSSKTFTIAPAAGYQIASLTVDGAPVALQSGYVFSNVTTNHSISATFSLLPKPAYTIMAYMNGPGTITPSGAVSVNAGASKTFAIAPNSSAYRIAGVSVDGIPVGIVSSYTFSNVAAAHTLAATFGLPASPSACDVNNDGVTNVLDLQSEINMALGIASCSADINRDSLCNVIDVQRVTNAALTGQCVSP